MRNEPAKNSFIFSKRYLIYFLKEFYNYRGIKKV